MSDFTTSKSIFVLAIVAGCFAILWPNVFYPMFQGQPLDKIAEQGKRGGSGCCDVLFDKDVDAIKLVSELCGKVLEKEHNYERDYALYLQQGKLTKAIVKTCQKSVLKQCAVDVADLLNEKVNLGRSYKQLVDELRSLNSSLCLKHAFGISFGNLGNPRQMRIWGINQPKHMHQERPPHLRPEFLHPALREKGRAIPQSHVVPKVVIEGRPGPIPGLRPPMGGAGHVVPPPKGGSTMGIVMPMYTIGIVVFFLYTMMKLIFKKSDVSSSYELSPDPDFGNTVFGDGCNKTFANGKEAFDDSKLVVTAITGLVEEVNRQIRSELLPENKVAQTQEDQTKLDDNTSKASQEEVSTLDDVEIELLQNVVEEDDSGKGSVKVLGMEMTESCEKGARWSRPPTPLSRPTTPQNIYITGPLAPSSKLLVSDSHTETSADDNSVVLTGKVTLSLIGLDKEEIEALESQLDAGER
uniref:Resistance to inhibitors of cholinesterase protein 3 n=1 Tax=Lygus hesperus TaxID=30085 RepID=A0A0A9Z8B7_LYGHE